MSSTSDRPYIWCVDCNISYICYRYSDRLYREVQVEYYTVWLGTGIDLSNISHMI